MESSISQKPIIKSGVFLVVLLVIFGGADSRPPHRFGLERTGQKDDKIIYAGRAQADWSSESGKGALFHAGSDISEQNGLRTSFGVFKHDGSKIGANGGVGASLDLLSAGIEKNNGIMGRAAVVKHTLHLGNVDVNTGLKFDSGVSFKDGFEAKLLGLGSKITKDEVELCFYWCIGVKWG